MAGRDFLWDFWILQCQLQRFKLKLVSKLGARSDRVINADPGIDVTNAFFTR